MWPPFLIYVALSCGIKVMLAVAVLALESRAVCWSQKRLRLSFILVWLSHFKSLVARPRGPPQRTKCAVPPRIGPEQLAKLMQAQFLVIDVDNQCAGFIVRNRSVTGPQ